ncbi:MAG: HAD-IA family hydrolase [Clostridia bacterium]|nr:HAD-IA family hydrolase [Clostridia bacterium]
MINTVIFDFDGTIINTNSLIEEGLNHFSYMHRGYHFTKEEMLELTGKPLETQMAAIDKQLSKLLVEQFKVWYSNHHNQKTSAFPGMIELLRFLRRLNLNLAIVTNNSRPSLEMGLKHLGIEDVFHITLSRDEVSATKPEPDGLIKVLNKFEVHPHDAIFIGDTDNDILAAKAAGIKSVMVAWSILDENSIKALSPDHILHESPQLLELLAQSIVAA